MGRPPSNGGPSFRFNQSEIAEMEAILRAHKAAMPAREVLVSLAEKFSNSEERKGKIEVQMKQVWNWFQNRRYAIRAKAAKSPGKLNITPTTRDDSVMAKGVPQAAQPHAASSATVRSLPQAPQHPTGPSAAVRTFSQPPQHPAAFSVQSAGRVADNSQMEYEAKSARDGAWYDVSTFLSHRSLETGDPEVLVRFAGFGAEEDEWVNVRKNVRQRSLPCESSECVAVLPADLILCFQEGKEQALYFDAHVLDAQRRRHDVRGCRCRFLVRYDHDQSEEIVALRKICRRPETDYRLQQLHAVNESLSANHNKNGANNVHTVSTLRVYPPAEIQPKLHKLEPPPPEAPQKRQKVEPDTPQDQHMVQSVPSDPSAEPQKVEPMVAPSPSPSDQTSLALQKVEPTVATDSHEVPPETETTLVESSQDHHKAEPERSEAAEKEPMMSDPSVKAPQELHQLQPDVPASTDDIEVIEAGIQQPEEITDGNKVNVDDNMDAKVSETVNKNNPPENAKDTETGSSDLPLENAKVVETGSSDLAPENAQVVETVASDLALENAQVAGTLGSDLAPEDAHVVEMVGFDLAPENAQIAVTVGSDRAPENVQVAETVGSYLALENAQVAETGSSDLALENAEVAEIGSSDLPPENVKVVENGSCDLPPENVKVAETGSSDMLPENAKVAETESSNMLPEMAEVAETGSSDQPAENATVAESPVLSPENSKVGTSSVTGGDMEEG